MQICYASKLNNQNKITTKIFKNYKKIKYINSNLTYNTFNNTKYLKQAY